jgi:hypothetical protein
MVVMPGASIELVKLDTYVPKTALSENVGLGLAGHRAH